MISPLDHLAREIVRDNAIVFIGSQLRATPGEPPLLARIAWQLAQQLHDYDGPTDNLTAVAEAFELDAGRPELIRSLREISEGVDAETASITRQIAAAIAPYTKIITTRFDRAFEDALDTVDKLYVRIVRDDDVRNFDETRVALVKLRGDIHLDDTLILTTTDFEQFLDNLPVVNDVIRAFFATKTFIFLGYDLDDPLFRRFFLRVAGQLETFRRAAYAIVPGDVPPRTRKLWEKAKVHIHVEPDLEAFLQQLQTAVHASTPPGNIPPALIANPLAAVADPPRPSEPYKALESYALNDARVFAGRRDEARRLTNRILGHRLVVLYGESGSGKTSLLQAGTRPLLAEKRALLVSCEPTAGESITSALQSALHTAIAGTDLPAPTGQSLPAQLQSVQTALDGPIVLTVDQFEQIFVALNADERTVLLTTLQNLRQRQDLDLRIVVVIREDFLGRLQTVDALLPGLLDTRFRLERLGIEAAREAIEKPAGAFGVAWATELVDRLLHDLANNRGVAPPQLQIVCKQLYDAARRSAAEQSRPFQEISLVPFEAAGGTEAILGDYIERIVAGFSLPRQETARRLLGAMVSSSRTKLRLPVDELARAADCDVDTAVLILNVLREERLVNRYDEPDATFPAYELTHDYLALRVIHWLGPEFWEMQRARELLRQAVPEWEKHGRLIGPGDLQTISQHRADLRLNEAEHALIYAAAVSYAADPEQWRTRIADASAVRILLQLAANPDTFVRRAALPHLREVATQAEVAAALAQSAIADPDNGTRTIAAATIGNARSTTAVDALLSIKNDAPQAVAQAWFTVTERWPAADRLIPADMRTAVQRLRWQAHWRTLLRESGRGFVGGTIALGGLGLAVVINQPDTINAFLQVRSVAELLGMILGQFIYMGLFGGLALAVTALLQGVLTRIAAPAGQLTRALVIGAAALALGTAFILITDVFSGTAPGGWRIFAAGFAIGLVTSTAVLAPLPLSTRARTAAVLLISVGLFVVLNILGIAFQFTAVLAAPLAGLFNGAGFLLALPPWPEPGRVTQSD